MNRLLSLAKRITQKKTARNASWIMFGQGSNFFLQAAYFVLLARLLGVAEYGIFAGAYALVNIIAPYAALGGGMLFMRYVIADRSSAKVYWGNALLTIMLASTILCAGLCLLGPRISGVQNSWIFFYLTIGNCFFMQISGVASQIFQAYEQLKLTAIISFSSNLARLLVLLVMVAVLRHATALQWSVGVMIASGIAATYAIILVYRKVQGVECSWSLLRKRVAEGVGFSFAGTTQAVYTDIDKTLLTHYGLDKENGFYTLAYRIIDFVTTPVMALDLATIPKYFALSRTRLLEVLKLAIRSVKVSLAMGIGIALGTLLVAPLILPLVGRDFSGALVALRWLCWIPLCRGVHRLMGSGLTGTGYQWLRTSAQFTVAALNIGLNVWWIPAFGWIGAAWSSVICDGTLAILNTALLVIVWKLQDKNKQKLSEC